jgi:hypothetical protein
MPAKESADLAPLLDEMMIGTSLFRACQNSSILASTAGQIFKLGI